MPIVHVYRIADRNIEISSLHSMVHKMSSDFLCDAVPELSIAVGQTDIDRERAAAGQDVGVQLEHGYCIGGTLSDAYLESLAVYRGIADKMPDYDSILMHGSALALDGTGFLFTAPSGVGKSTHARLWRELYGNRVIMINDDKPLLHIGNERVTVFGTPWNGKHRLGGNVSAPLRAICFLTRGKENAIRLISIQEAYPLLLRQFYRPADPAALVKTLRLADRLLGSIRFYRLECNMQPEAAKLSSETMKG